MKKANKSEAAKLRQKAEELLKKKPLKTVSQLSGAEAQKLIHELEVHQIELELINEELTLAKEQAEIATEKYTELADFASSGYFTLSNEGKIIVDITERKQAEEVFKNSLSLTEATLESIHNGILVVSRQGTVIKTNAKFAEMWHIPTDIINSGDDKTLLDNVLGQLADPDRFIAKVSELYGQPEAKSVDLIYFKDGRIFERISKPMYFGEEPKGRVWSFLDITERKQAEKELIQSEQRYRSIIETAPDVIYTLAADSRRITSLNPAFETLTGWSRDEIIGKPFEFLVHPEDSQIATRTFKQVLKGKHPPVYELRILAKSGAYLVGEFTSIPHFENGKIIGEFGFARDITDRKRVEENLRISEKKYRNLVEYALIGIYTSSLKGKLLFANNAMCKMLEYDSFDEFINAGVTSTYKNKEEREKFIEIIKDSKQIFNYEIELVTKKGKPINVILNSFISGEEITGTMLDISDRKRAEEELKKKLDELQRFHHLTIGRELTMIELKKEVNELLKQSGREEKYKIVE